MQNFKKQVNKSLKRIILKLNNYKINNPMVMDLETKQLVLDFYWLLE